MEVKEKLYTVDDLWEMEQDPAFENRFLYLIDGELFEDAMPGRTHGRIAIKIGRYLDEFAESHNLGEVTAEVGYSPARSRYTLLLPDVAFMRHESLPQPPPEGFVPAMPDLAVEILSPGNTLAELRRKAQVYLENGTALVWLALPKRPGVEVCRLLEGRLRGEFVGIDGMLSGEDILPGFELDVKRIFSAKRS